VAVHLSKERVQQRALSWSFLLPTLVFYTVFLVYPVVYIIRLSFYGGVGGGSGFVGFQNYYTVFSSSEFWSILKNTVIWVALTTTLKVSFGLGLALFLNRQFAGKKLLTLVILLPWATPYITSAITWRWMYNPIYGHLNNLLLKLHIIRSPIAFLGNPSTALVSVALTHAWTGIPFCALTFLSVLYAIPRSYYDAAAVDGANSWRAFWHITLPLLTPTLLMVTVLVSVWGFNAFGVIWSMTRGGPLQSSETLLTYIYRVFFVYTQYGKGAAIAVICLVILVVASILYVWLRRRVEIEIG